MLFYHFFSRKTKRYTMKESTCCVVQFALLCSALYRLFHITSHESRLLLITDYVVNDNRYSIWTSNGPFFFVQSLTCSLYSILVIFFSSVFKYLHRTQLTMHRLSMITIHLVSRVFFCLMSPITHRLFLLLLSVDGLFLMYCQLSLTTTKSTT